VVGCVRKPGGVVLGEKESITVLQAVSLAEGLDHGAASRDARIIRTVAGAAKATEIPVNVEKILANKEPDQGLQSSDILFVPTSVTKNAALRSAEAALQMATGIVIFRR
jgi:polysaccharide export outer membrane protein